VLLNLCETAAQEILSSIRRWPGIIDARARYRAAAPPLRNTGLDNVGPSKSHNPMGLHDLVQGQRYFTFFYFIFTSDKQTHIYVFISNIITSTLQTW
jgi:hypothetical protein